MLMAPKGSNGGIVSTSGLQERHCRTVSVYCMGGWLCATAKRPCAHFAAEEAFQKSAGCGSSCLISRWDSERGTNRN